MVTSATVTDNSECEERIVAFLMDLQDLTLKHQLSIWACGCCEGPSLHDLSKKPYYGYRHPVAERLVWSEEFNCYTSKIIAHPGPTGDDEEANEKELNDDDDN